MFKTRKLTLASLAVGSLVVAVRAVALEAAIDVDTLSRGAQRLVLEAIVVVCAKANNLLFTIQPSLRENRELSL